MFLFCLLVSSIIAMVQWVFVINAAVILLIYPHTGRPMPPRLYELAIPGCLVLAWWTYRLLFQRRIAR
jgi:hypothetical protein